MYGVVDRTAYKEMVFCETFHSEETGWRECTSCGKVSKRIACPPSASYDTSLVGLSLTRKLCSVFIVDALLPVLP